MSPQIYKKFNHLLYLEKHESIAFEVDYEATRKALGYGILAFRRIYNAYKKQRGAV